MIAAVDHFFMLCVTNQHHIPVCQWASYSFQYRMIRRSLASPACVLCACIPAGVF